MKNKGKNAFIFVLDESLSFVRQKIGIFGPLSFKLILGLALGLASLFFFAKLSEDLLFNELLLFDRITIGIIRFFSSDSLTSMMKAISRLGSPLVLIIVGVVIMLYLGLIRKRFWDTLLVPLALGGGIILNEALKLLFHRSRPGLDRLVEAGGFSFPSGHSMMSFIFYGLLIYLVWTNFSSLTLRMIMTTGLAILILAVGISRIYLGVHYPSDVLAGFAAGSFWLVACLLGLRGIRHRKARR